MKQKAAQRLAELVPGVEQGARHAPMDFCPEVLQHLLVESPGAEPDAGHCLMKVACFNILTMTVVPGKVWQRSRQTSDTTGPCPISLNPEAGRTPNRKATRAMRQVLVPPALALALAKLA